ncbi:MAG: tetratricopeptide repeat protein [Pirellulales bacterium]
MSRSPNNEKAAPTRQWWQARNELAQMMKRGRSFSGHERHCCFMNTGGKRFATVSATSGLDFPDDGRALAITDWDQDGDLDLWVSNRNAPRLRFMRNNLQSENQFIALRLIGNGTTTNRDAVGARVEIFFNQAGTDQHVKTLRAGEGFLSQSSKWLHFGVVDGATIDKIAVHWPGGDLEEYTQFEVDHRYILQQGTSRHLLVKSHHEQLVVAPSTVPPYNPSRMARIPLVVSLPMPSLSYTDFHGNHQTMTFDSGKPILLNLWASWCQPCVAELKELTAREAELQEAGIVTVALAVDGVDGKDFEAASRMAERMNFPFLTGRANSDLLDVLQRLNNNLLVSWRPLPIPTSFLIDREGRLTVIYKGQVSVDQLLRDIRPTPDQYVERWKWAACLPGQALGQDQVVQTALEAEIRTRHRVASAQQSSGRLADAIRGFEALLQRDSERPEALAHLGSIYVRQNKLDRAIEYCQRALRMNPDHVQAHNTLGLAFVAKQRLADAKHHYLQAISIQPDFAFAHNNLGSLLASQGDFKQAQQHFSHAIASEPDFAEAHTNLGSIYAIQKNLKMAAKHYQEAIRLDPNYAEAYNNLGSIFARNGNLQQALQYYQRALQINPDYREAQRNLKRLQTQLKTK